MCKRDPTTVPVFGYNLATPDRVVAAGEAGEGVMEAVTSMWKVLTQSNKPGRRRIHDGKDGRAHRKDWFC